AAVSEAAWGGRAQRAGEGAGRGEGPPRASEPGCGAEPHVKLVKPGVGREHHGERTRVTRGETEQVIGSRERGWPHFRRESGFAHLPERHARDAVLLHLDMQGLVVGSKKPRRLA